MATALMAGAVAMLVGMAVRPVKVEMEFRPAKLAASVVARAVMAAEVSVEMVRQERQVAMVALAD